MRDPATRAAIVDDHELVALALGPVIDAHPRLDFVGHYVCVKDLLRSAQAADLVVLDLFLRDGSTPQANVDELRRHGMEVLVLTSGENPYLVREVSQCGVLGILRKSLGVADVVEAIARAAAGGNVATTEWAAALDTGPPATRIHLTEREREVLALYASGLGAKQVATKLHISENTVDDHIRRIRQVYQQLNRPANTKVELYQRGLQDGLLPLPVPRT
ncbi:response regulator transcription factor [Nesterenkonia ebinurensis]|uniref:response regulator transcription factor n=1 Tax=Nesterenkonia ebinurensis TaxID=2608252 RepID=UPI00123CDA2E|nr:response regulator transcription factor [Nesterenkonia ebinurensis]